MTWSPPAWTLGDRLRKARESAGWQIKDVTAASGVPGQSIGPWEAGRRIPSPTTLAAVVRVIAPRLGASEAELTDWIRGASTARTSKPKWIDLENQIAEERFTMGEGQWRELHGD